MKASTFLFSILVFAATSRLAAQNVVFTSGFEQWEADFPADWTKPKTAQQGAGRLEQCTTDVHSGASCVKFALMHFSRRLHHGAFNLRAGQEVTVQFWAKGKGRITFGLNTPADQVYYLEAQTESPWLFIDTTEWSLFTISRKARQTSDKASFYLDAYPFDFDPTVYEDTPSELLLDDIQLITDVTAAEFVRRPAVARTRQRSASQVIPVFNPVTAAVLAKGLGTGPEFTDTLQWERDILPIDGHRFATALTLKADTGRFEGAIEIKYYGTAARPVAWYLGEMKDGSAEGDGVFAWLDAAGDTLVKQGRWSKGEYLSQPVLASLIDRELAVPERTCLGWPAKGLPKGYSIQRSIACSDMLDPDSVGRAVVVGREGATGAGKVARSVILQRPALFTKLTATTDDGRSCGTPAEKEALPESQPPVNNILFWEQYDEFTATNRTPWSFSEQGPHVCGALHSNREGRMDYCVRTFYMRASIDSPWLPFYERSCFRKYCPSDAVSDALFNNTEYLIYQDRLHDALSLERTILGGTVYTINPLRPTQTFAQEALLEAHLQKEAFNSNEYQRASQGDTPYARYMKVKQALLQVSKASRTYAATDAMNVNRGIYLSHDSLTLWVVAEDGYGSVGEMMKVIQVDLRYPALSSADGYLAHSKVIEVPRRSLYVNWKRLSQPHIK